jgi:NADPH:quinone reductase-like Zn-dependent oxidoreductase
MMKAVVQDRYGAPEEVLQVREVEKPAVGDNHVRVRVRAASVHPDVWHVVTGRPHALRLMGAGLRGPKIGIPGTDLAGEVESVGRNVTRFRVGDEVFGESLTGHQWMHGASFAEYASVAQDALAHKPVGVSFEQAAAVCTSGLIVLNNLREPHAALAGRRVLVNGAGGGVGSVALQVARARGAIVTGVDKTHKLAMLRALGADEVIDCHREDFTRLGQRYDLIFDVASNLSLTDCQRVLTPKGAYILIGHDHFGAVGGRALGSLPRFFGLLAMSPFVSQLPAANFSAPDRQASMQTLKSLLEAGSLAPVIARSYPLSEVPAAIRHLQGGEACGKILITP